VTKELNKAGVKAEAIHGNKVQNARQRALNNFKNGPTRVLVATDIAARGIDVDDLSHVFNYDLPNVPETYVHRIGRTGRAGASGVAISFCMFEELPYLKDIQKLTGVMIPVVDGHPFPMIETEGKEVTLPTLSNDRNSNNHRPAGNGQRSGSGYNQRSRKPRPRARQSA
jgi:ATP-dependent RNA helicase RhlE